MKMKTLVGSIIGLIAFATAVPASAGWVVVYYDERGNQVGADLRCSDMGQISYYMDGPWSYFIGPDYIDTSAFGCV